MLGESLKVLRESKGLVQRQVAAELEVDTAYISKMESNEKPVSKQHLKKLSIMLGIKEDELFTLWLADKLFYLAKDEEKTILTGEFNISKIDSINYDDISKLENFSLPFTRGDLPPEPIAPSIIEPLIAISSAVLTVVLFFTVRSK